jgi:hypothetical protein
MGMLTFRLIFHCHLILNQRILGIANLDRYCILPTTGQMNLDCLEFGLQPGTTKLHIRFSGIGYSNEGINSSKSILIGFTSNIKINAIGRNAELLVNGTFVSSVELPGTRTTGTSILHISEPWYDPARAFISNVNMVPLNNMIKRQEGEPPLSFSLLPNPTQLSPKLQGITITLIFPCPLIFSLTR